MAVSHNSRKVGQENTNRDKFLRQIWSFSKLGMCLEPTFEAAALITGEACKLQSKSWPEATYPQHPPPTAPPLMIFLLMFNTRKQVHYLLCINLSQIKLIYPGFMVLPFKMAICSGLSGIDAPHLCWLTSAWHPAEKLPGQGTALLGSARSGSQQLALLTTHNCWSQDVEDMKERRWSCWRPSPLALRWATVALRWPVMPGRHVTTGVMPLFDFKMDFIKEFNIIVVLFL